MAGHMQTNAPRFRLRPGEAVLVDNFRMLHGRDPYTDLRRKLWRLWHWTDMAMDVPLDTTVVQCAVANTEAGPVNSPQHAARVVGANARL